MKMILPFPPTVNTYWRHVGPRTLISRKGREYRRAICGLLAGGGPRKPPAGGRIALSMDAFPPDRRRRDLDNLPKAVLDSLAHAGVYEDDSQIDLLIIRRQDLVKGGKLGIQIGDMPLNHCLLCGNEMNSRN